MSEYNPAHESLNILLEQLEKMHIHLQSNLTDFVIQIKLKTRNWMDKTSDTDMTFKDIVAMVTAASTTLIEHLDIIAEYNMQSTKTIVQHKTPGVTDTNDSQTDGSRNKLEKRVEILETTLSTLTITNQKTEDDVTHIKQWSDACSTEQSELKEQIEQLSLKQKQNSKNFRKQFDEQKSITDEMNEEMKQLNEIKQWRETFMSGHNTMAKKLEELSKKQIDSKEKFREEIKEIKTRINELNREIESLKEKEFDSIQKLEIMNKEMNTFDIVLNRINEELEVHTDKTDNLQQQVQSHSDLISNLQKEEKKNMNTATKVEKLISMLRVTNKILHQRLMPIENLIQKFNLNLVNRQLNKNKLETLENEVLKLLKDAHSNRQEIKGHSALISTLQDDGKKNLANTSNMLGTFNKKIETQVSDVLKLAKYFKTIEARVCKPYICDIYLDNDTPVTAGSILSTFQLVWEPNGSQFNQKTGKLVAPDDGDYLVIVTLQEREDKQITVGVLKGGNELQKQICVKSAFTSACGSTIVAMKKGETLYFKVHESDEGAMLQAGSGFSIVSL